MIFEESEGGIENKFIFSGYVQINLIYAQQLLLCFIQPRISNS